MLKEKKPRRGGERKVRQYLTGFSCFHCVLPDEDFPDVRGRGRIGRGCEGGKNSNLDFLIFYLFIFFSVHFLFVFL